jgi:hypothetical protein
MRERKNGYTPRNSGEPVATTYRTIEDRRTHPFFQVDNVVIEKYAPIIGATPFLIYATICKFANAKSGECRVYVGTIARTAGVSEATVFRALNVLTADEKDPRITKANLPPLIAITNRFDKEGRQVSSSYAILNVWCDPRVASEQPSPSRQCNTSNKSSSSNKRSISKEIDAPTAQPTDMANPEGAEPSLVYQIVKAWVDVAEIDEFPAPGTQPYGMAKNAIAAGLNVADVAPIYRWLNADPWWKNKGIDIANISGQKSRWLSLGKPGAGSGEGSSAGTSNGRETWADHLKKLRKKDPFLFVGSAEREALQQAREEWEAEQEQGAATPLAGMPAYTPEMSNHV